MTVFKKMLRMYAGKVCVGRKSRDFCKSNNDSTLRHQNIQQVYYFNINTSLLNVRVLSTEY